MRVVLTHKIELCPTGAQEALLCQAVGVARFAYNWALAEWQRQYEVHKQDPTLPPPSEAALRRQLNAIKRKQFPWMLSVPKSVPQQAIKNLGNAFRRFFCKQGSYPTFKKKGVHDSARFDNGPGTFRCEGKRIRLPVIGWVKMREALRFYGKPLSATVSRIADRWYVSIPVEVEMPVPIRESQAAVGIDLGVTTAVTLSTGEKLAGPKALDANLKKLRRLSRQLSRKQKSSNNRRKAARRLAKLHAQIANIRQDWLHKATAQVVCQFDLIAIEDLNVQGMMANKRLARHIADIGMYEFKRQLQYKAALYGAKVVVVDRWYPSSKICAACGHRLDNLSLSVRQWTCPVCNSQQDRDVNAAKNILVAGLAILNGPTVSWTGSHACGEEGSGVVPQGTACNHTSLKQESNLSHLGGLSNGDEAIPSKRGRHGFLRDL